MEKFVSQEECEYRRKELNDKIDENREDISKLYGIISANTTEIKNLTKVMSTQIGLITTVMGGIILWLLTK